jgi:TonB family protein
VQDFSQSIDPVTDLALARAASSDGRVCGSFRATQLQRPRLTQRLRWFVVALVLVVGQGLTAREALAQVRRPTGKAHTTSQMRHPVKRPAPTAPAIPLEEEVYITSGAIELMPADTIVVVAAPTVYTYVAEMPALPGGKRGDNAALAALIQKSTLIPAFHEEFPAESRLVYEFTVTETGEVRDARIIKGIDPRIDAAVLQAIHSLPRFLPGRQAGVPVRLRYTMPITFIGSS